jgi:hypothetical protein
LNERFTYNKIIEIFYELDHDKICQVISAFDLMAVAARESCDLLANLVAANSQ